MSGGSGGRFLARTLGEIILKWWHWSTNNNTKPLLAAGFCSRKLLLGKCWALTWGISLLAKDQKAIHRDKKSLITGSGRLWPRLQQTGSVSIACVHPCRQSYFRTSQTLQSRTHCLYSFPECLRTGAHKAPRELELEWTTCHRQKLCECIWISKEAELSGPSLRTPPNCVNCSSLFPTVGGGLWGPSAQYQA